jgi:DNA-binding CsgD family transcriptional regulator
MGTMIRGVLRRSWNRTFLTSLALILAAEAVTFVVAWLSLDFNTKRWIDEKTAQAMRISQQVSTSFDWSGIATIPKEESSPLFDRYHKKVVDLSRQYFQKAGSIYLIRVEHGEEYDVDTGDTDFVDGGKANDWELKAYSTHAPTLTPIPFSDDSGTYLAAYTPIVENGNVVGLVGAEYDSAPLADFRGIVQSTFIFSMVPAVLLSLFISYFLAGRLMEPMQLFRAIEVRKQGADPPEGVTSPWDVLTPSEVKVFDLWVKGRTAPEIATALSLSVHAVKSHVKSIYRKTRLSRMELAIEAEARRA